MVARMTARKLRARTPVVVEKLHGNPGRRPLPDDAPEGVGELWAAPEWMDDDQRTQWRWAVLKSPPGLLTETDRECLAIWCCASVEYAKAIVEVRRAGQIVKTKEGKLITNPYLPLANRQAFIMLRTGAEMGFSPASRAAIGAVRGAPVAAAGFGRSSKLTNYIEGNPDAVH
jgi:P27 family predicted phage terminase small subunit